jgi:hypothetical protein
VNFANPVRQYGGVNWTIRNGKSPCRLGSGIFPSRWSPRRHPEPAAFPVQIIGDQLDSSQGPLCVKKHISDTFNSVPEFGDCPGTPKYVEDEKLAGDSAGKESGNYQSLPSLATILILRRGNMCCGSDEGGHSAQANAVHECFLESMKNTHP